MFRAVGRAYRDAFGGLPREIWLLSIALFVNRCGAMVLAFLTLYLTTQLKFSISEAGAIFSIWGFGSLVGAYLGGKLVRPLGAIRVQIIALFLAMPCYLVVPLFTSWASVAISVFLFSVTSEGVRPANNVAVTQFVSKELTTRAFGLQRLAVNLGLSFGPAIGGVLAEVNFTWLFIVDGITTGLGALILLYYFGWNRSALPSAELGQTVASDETAIGPKTQSPIRDARFICFLLLMLSVAIIFFQFMATYPKYLEDHYLLSKPKIGLVFALNTAIIVIAEMLLLNGIRRFSLLRVIGVGSFLACLGFGILPFGNALWFCMFSMILITVGEMLMFPLGTSFVAHRSEGRDQGTYMSWYAMMYSTAAILAPIVGTSLYEFNPHALWYISLGVGAIALVGFYAMSIWNDESESEPNAKATMSPNVDKTTDVEAESALTLNA